MWDMDTLWEERGNIDPREGLPVELFEWISSMVPIPNVDLMIINNKKQILLSWRNDEYYGKGWHLPGGCIRFKESIEERIQRTAIAEIGTEVITDAVPLAVKDMIMGKFSDIPFKRAHHVALLIKCTLPNDFIINNHGKDYDDMGYLEWFDKIPENILDVHDIYFDVFRECGLM